MSDTDQPDGDLLDVLSAVNDARRNASFRGSELVIETDWVVGQDGRLHIPQEKRQEYGIEKGDLVDAVLVVSTDDAEEDEQ